MIDKAGEPGTALVFRLPVKANVDRCISALQELESDAAPHLAKEQLEQARAALVFAYWGKVMHKIRAILDLKRERRLRERLRENEGDVSELLYAVDGAKADDWIMGRDVKSPRPYNGIETIFRDREQVERFAEQRPAYRHGEAHPLATKYGL